MVLYIEDNTINPESGSVPQERDANLQYDVDGVLVSDNTDSQRVGVESNESLGSTHKGLTTTVEGTSDILGYAPSLEGLKDDVRIHISPFGKSVGEVSSSLFSRTKQQARQAKAA